MNRIYLIIFSLALALVGGRAQEVPVATNSSASDGMLFRNGDLFYGKLLSIDGQNAVRWRHADVAEPIEFNSDNIAQINFPAPKNLPPAPENACRVLLADGSVLEGALVSGNRETVILETWYAGRLTIPRASMQSLVCIPRSPAVFDGITGLDGWTQGISAAAVPIETGHWIYRNGAFYCDKPASIARNLSLPDVADIQFDLAWKGGLYLAIAIYTDSLLPILVTAKDQGPDFAGFYSLRLQNSFSFSVDCWPIKKNERLRSLGQTFAPSLNNKERTHVDLRVSKPQHKMALYMDDALVKEWDDPEGFVGEGKGMRFVQNIASPLKLSNLRITEWNGIFTETASEPPDTTHDSITLENRPNVKGNIESFANGKLTIRTDKESMEIPLTDVKSIEFAHHASTPPQNVAASVRGTFAQGGGLLFTLDSWQPDEMIIHSPDFGKIKVNPAAFTRLQFLPKEKKPGDGPKG